jgi:hypothetical protein
MKHWFPVFLRVALASAALSASSCVYDPGIYSDSGYSSYDDDYPSANYHPGYTSSYRSYPRTYGSFSTGYYSSYGGHGYCSVCRRNPCGCSSYRRHDHDDHDTVHSFKKLDSSNLRVVGGSTGSKVRPQGEHSLDWYKDRGYDTSRMKFRDEHGHTFGGSNVRSSSSSSRSSSSSSRSRDNDDHDHKKSSSSSSGGVLKRGYR